MPPVGFEPTISVGERAKTYALDRAATGIGKHNELFALNKTWPLLDHTQMGSLVDMREYSSKPFHFAHIP